LTIASTALPRVLLVDIEGTIGDVAFVRNVLFPYARERLQAFLEEHGAEPEVRAIIADAAALSNTPALEVSEAVELFRSWIDEDRKATPLKALQGMIWRAGYEAGLLRAHLYDDAVPALRALSARGIPVWVYSSGSVEAQRLYFRYSVAGDVTDLFRGYFDTRTGAKVEAASYRRIAADIGVEPRELLFATDLDAEIDAAREAGLSTVQLDRKRPPASAIEVGARGPVATSFDALPSLLARPA
jgi:enolase-phosphatase E1